MLKHLDRITFDPKIMTGKACIRGMRIPVSLILNLYHVRIITYNKVFVCSRASARTIYRAEALLRTLIIITI